VGADAHSGGYTHEGVRVEDFPFSKNWGILSAFYVLVYSDALWTSLERKVRDMG